MIDLGQPVPVNRFLAQEYIRLGQRVRKFSVEAFVDGKWQHVASGTTIGAKRILRFPVVTTGKIRFNILESKACPVISNIELFMAER